MGPDVAGGSPESPPDAGAAPALVLRMLPERVLPLSVSVPQQLAAVCAISMAVCVVGDHATFHVAKSASGRAVLDSATHAALSGLAWLTASLYARGAVSPLLLVCATGLGSAVDADHFLAARSLSLSRATSRSRRPPAHSALLLAACVAVTALCQPWLARWLRRRVPRAYGPSVTSAASHLPALVLAAWGAHLLRDAARRGVWLWPLGSTAPLGGFAVVAAAPCIGLAVGAALVLGQGGRAARRQARRGAGDAMRVEWDGQQPGARAVPV